MDDLLLWLVVLVVAIIMIVAQCQLFGIRRALETLVRYQSLANSPYGKPEETAPDGQPSSGFRQRS